MLNIVVKDAFIISLVFWYICFQSKIVLGVMPGHHDAGNEYTSMEDTIKATKEAMDMGLAGTSNK